MRGYCDNWRVELDCFFARKGMEHRRDYRHGYHRNRNADCADQANLRGEGWNTDVTDTTDTTEMGTRIARIRRIYAEKDGTPT